MEISSKKTLRIVSELRKSPTLDVKTESDSYNIIDTEAENKFNDNCLTALDINVAHGNLTGASITASTVQDSFQILQNQMSDYVLLPDLTYEMDQATSNLFYVNHDNKLDINIDQSMFTTIDDWSKFDNVGNPIKTLTLDIPFISSLINQDSQYMGYGLERNGDVLQLSWEVQDKLNTIDLLQSKISTLTEQMGSQMEQRFDELIGQLDSFLETRLQEVEEELLSNKNKA